MFFPVSQNEVVTLLKILHEFGLRPLVIGNGTNLLAEDGSLDFIVIKTYGGLNGIKLTDDTEITAESGVLLSKLASFAMERGLTGLEFAHGIPGTLGGAVSMNAGAYGGEIKNIVMKTTALTPDAAHFDINGDAHEFSTGAAVFQTRATDTLLRAEAGKRRFRGNQKSNGYAGNKTTGEPAAQCAKRRKHV